MVAEGPPPAEFEIFRNWRTTLFIVVYWSFYLIFMAGLALNASAPVAGRLFGVAAGAVCGVWIVWMLRTGIVADAAGLRIRQFRGRTVSVPWAEVSDLVLKSNGKGGVYVSVLKRGGKSVETQGLAFSNRGRAEVVLCRLRFLWDRYLAAGENSLDAMDDMRGSGG